MASANAGANGSAVSRPGGMGGVRRRYAHLEMNVSETAARTSIRRKGFLRFMIGLVTFAVGLTIPMFVLPYFGEQLTPPGMIPFALPGAYALSGLIELATGISFLELARRWDDLKGWQRGIFGTFIVLIGGALVLAIIGSIGYWASHR
jgi:hypothetical protein